MFEVVHRPTTGNRVDDAARHSVAFVENALAAFLVIRLEFVLGEIAQHPRLLG